MSRKKPLPAENCFYFSQMGLKKTLKKQQQLYTPSCEPITFSYPSPLHWYLNSCQYIFPILFSPPLPKCFSFHDTCKWKSKSNPTTLQIQVSTFYQLRALPPQMPRLSWQLEGNNGVGFHDFENLKNNMCLWPTHFFVLSLFPVNHSFHECWKSKSKPNSRTMETQETMYTQTYKFFPVFCFPPPTVPG